MINTRTQLNLWKFNRKPYLKLVENVFNPFIYGFLALSGILGGIT